MKKKYLWLFLLIIPIFLGAWLFIPHGSEGEISDHDQFDAGYELLQSRMVWPKYQLNFQHLNKLKLLKYTMMASAFLLRSKATTTS